MQLFENCLCVKCVHLEATPVSVDCPAFSPNGIPEEILIGEFVHDKKHPDQKNEILFEEIPDFPE